jgi:hypothetical protein
MARWLPVVLLLAGLVRTDAQIAPRVEIYSAYTDNVFSTYQAQSDWMTFSYVDFDLALTSQTDLFYAGSASVFTDNDDLFSHTHRIGLTRYLHWDEEMWVTGTIDAALRLDRSTYDFRDYLLGHGALEMRYRPETAAWVLSGTYETKVQEYTHSTDYSFWENRARARWSRTLRPGTSLQLRAELATKSYLREADPDLLTEALFGSTHRDRHLVQWEGGIRVGQSLADWAGLQLEASRRQNLGGSGRLDASIIATDDDLFDDRFNYEGQNLGARLKVLGDWGSEISVGARHETRDFIDRVAYDLDGYSLGTTRSDTRLSLNLGVQKTFWLDNPWLSEISLQLDLMRRDADSNDPYYDAASHTVTTGIQIGF